MSAVYEWGYIIGPNIDISRLNAQSATVLWEQEMGPDVIAARNTCRDQEIANGVTALRNWQAKLNRGSRTLLISRQYTELAHAQSRQAWNEANLPSSTGNLTLNVSRCIDNTTLDTIFVTTDL
jgi:hypothetical protein